LGLYISIMPGDAAVMNVSVAPSLQARRFAMSVSTCEVST